MIRMPQSASLMSGITPRKAENLDSASRDFEQFLLKGMLERMLSTLEGGGLFEKENTSSRFFQSLFSEEIARDWSESGEVGISELITKSLGAKADPDQPLAALEASRMEARARRPHVTQQRPELESIARDSAATAELDPDWVCAIIECESSWEPRARSAKGARGLMQLMPATARELGVRDSWDPRQNIEGGVRYLKQLLDRFGGDRVLAAAAYNAGPNAVERHGGVPPYPETRNYVQRIEARLEETHP